MIYAYYARVLWIFLYVQNKQLYYNSRLPIIDYWRFYNMKKYLYQQNYSTYFFFTYLAGVLHVSVQIMCIYIPLALIKCHTAIWRRTLFERGSDSPVLCIIYYYYYVGSRGKSTFSDALVIIILSCLRRYCNTLWTTHCSESKVLPSGFSIE